LFLYLYSGIIKKHYYEEKMKAKIIVKLKETVLDPQGNTILDSLQEMGYKQIKKLRQGKIFFVDIDTKDKNKAKNILDEIAHKVLSNPVIESYEIELLK